MRWEVTGAARPIANHARIEAVEPRPWTHPSPAAYIHSNGNAKLVLWDECKTMMETISFVSWRDFRAWLAKNHDRSDGILLRIYKKDSGVASVTYAEALDQALCFGWIDGQKKPYDNESWLQKFTPRRARSGWSKKNTEHAERLIKSGEIASAGLKEVKAAKEDGRWGAAYDSFSTAAVPDDFLKELGRIKKANAFFQTLNKTNLYSIVYRLQTAKKPETREKRMRAIIDKLARGEKFH
jgi:uncharacterized protein YdeI (YjbR/CyaY-like superfamily)